MSAAPSRRSVLAASGLLAGLGVGIGAGKGFVADDDHGSGGEGSGALPTVLVSRTFRSVWPGVKLGDRPPVGTARLPYGELQYQDGMTAGEFEASLLSGARGSMHLHRIDLADGTLVGLGQAGLDGTFTIVGASGRYTGASGAYALHQTGDGGLEFNFDETKVV